MERGRERALGVNPWSQTISACHPSATVSFQVLHDLVDGLARKRSEETTEHNLKLVQALGRPERISALLRLVLQDEPLLVEIAARSYPQTNHFDEIVLIDSSDRSGYRLELHLWRPPYSDAQVVDEQIHHHRCDLWFNLVLGTLVSRNYVRSDRGVAFEEYRYVPEKRDVSTVRTFYRSVGQARLLEIEPSRIGAGDSYHLSHSQIHRVVLPRVQMTCTLVVRGPRWQSHASVFSNATKYDRSASTTFSPPQLASRLIGLLDEVQTARAWL
jgi:hypothetical protein